MYFLGFEYAFCANAHSECSIVGTSSASDVDFLFSWTILLRFRKTTQRRWMAMMNFYPSCVASFNCPVLFYVTTCRSSLEGSFLIMSIPRLLLISIPYLHIVSLSRVPWSPQGPTRMNEETDPPYIAPFQTHTYVLQDYYYSWRANVNVFHWRFFPCTLGQLVSWGSWCRVHMWVLIFREICLLIHILPIRYHMQNVAYEGAYTHISLSSLWSGGPSLHFPRAIPKEFNPQSLQNPSSLGAAMTNLICPVASIYFRWIILGIPRGFIIERWVPSKKGMNLDHSPCRAPPWAFWSILRPS